MVADSLISQGVHLLGIYNSYKMEMYIFLLRMYSAQINYMLNSLMSSLRLYCDIVGYLKSSGQRKHIKMTCIQRQYKICSYLFTFVVNTVPTYKISADTVVIIPWPCSHWGGSAKPFSVDELFMQTAGIISWLLLALRHRVLCTRGTGKSYNIETDYSSSS